MDNIKVMKIAPPPVEVRVVIDLPLDVAQQLSWLMKRNIIIPRAIATEYGQDIKSGVYKLLSAMDRAFLSANVGIKEPGQ